MFWPNWKPVTPGKMLLTARSLPSKTGKSTLTLMTTLPTAPISTDLQPAPEPVARLCGGWGERVEFQATPSPPQPTPSEPEVEAELSARVCEGIREGFVTDGMLPNRLICRDDSWLEAYQNDSRSFEGWELPTMLDGPEDRAMFLYDLSMTSEEMTKVPFRLVCRETEPFDTTGAVSLDDWELLLDSSEPETPLTSVEK